MELDIRGISMELTESIDTHVRNRLTKDLSHFAARVRKVTVRVSDVNGPRGGMDKRCHMEATATGVEDAHADEVDSDLYRAIDQASTRLRKHLTRLIDKDRSRGLKRRISASGLPT
jgi:ribosomal subunit interface protein